LKLYLVLNKEEDGSNRYFELLKPLLKSKYYTTKALAYPNDIDRIYNLKSLDLSVGFPLYENIEAGASFSVNFAIQPMDANTKNLEFILCYKFRTIDYDIKFGVYKVNSLQFNTIDEY